MRSLGQHLVILSFLLISATAFANVVGNDTQNFNPITSGVDFVTVQSSTTLAPGLANFGFFLNTSRNVLPDTVDGAGNLITSGDQLTTSDINIGYGIRPGLDIGLNLSALLQQTTDRSEPGAQFGATGLDEARLNLKSNFTETETFGAAVVLSANFNQVKDNPFLGENPGPTLNLELVGDTRIGDVVLAANVGYRHRSHGDALASSLYKPIKDQTIASVAASRYFPAMDFKLIGEIYAAKSEIDETSTRVGSLATEIIVGGKYDVTRAASIHAGVGQKLNDGLFAPDFRAYVGMNYVYEVIPIAPQTVIQTTQIVDIYNGYQPKDIEHLMSTPFDELSKEHEFQLRARLGDDALADEKPPFEIVRLEGLDFETGSAKILPRHEPLLARLIQYLNSVPEVLKMRIEGHTDSIGSEEKNRRLSGERVKSVREYLLKHGMNPDLRIEAEGFGSSRPVADNGNFQGRRANRRVEVRLLRKIKSPPKKTEVREGVTNSP